jgi:hypothetical protein
MVVDIRYVLSLPLERRAREQSCAQTIGGFLRALLETLWYEGFNFNAKRPFGITSWQHDLSASLVRAAVVEGTIDEDGFLEDYDPNECDKIISEAIAHIFREWK